jgi:class I fructose-bisphosphate aldolase
MNFGKASRLDSITGQDTPFVLPLDHGLSSGPQRGIERVQDLTRLTESLTGRIAAVVVHRGIVRQLSPDACPPLILQTMGMPAISDTPSARQIVAAVDDALQLAAVAIAVQIDYGGQAMADELRSATVMIAAASRWDVPVMVMVSGTRWATPTDLSAAVRRSVELGADLVKIDPGRLIEAEQANLEGCGVPVLMAGGADLSRLEAASEWAGRSGFTGLCIGRGVYQSRDPKGAVQLFTDCFQRGKAERRPRET